MEVRKPTFDFAGLHPHWSPSIEFSQAINAGGTVPTHIEPFLIKTIRRAKELLDSEADAALIDDIEIFCRQEAEHYKLHRAWNKVIRDAGYPGMAGYEAALVADYERFLDTKSLRWLLAYCEGFESMGPVVAKMWIENEWAHYLEGADRRPADLWTWHFAEEFEHRTVVHGVYQRLYGKKSISAYFYRIYGLFCLSRHVFGHIAALRQYLLATDRATMTEDEATASKRRERKLSRETLSRQRGALRILSPFYNPETIRPPKGYAAVLARY